MQEMVIYGVSFDMVGKQPIVLLKTVDGNKFLPIWIGHPEAAAILMKLQGTPTPRPMTHDLVTDMLGELNASVSKVAVTELRENTFYAQITVENEARAGALVAARDPSSYTGACPVVATTNKIGCAIVAILILIVISVLRPKEHN